MYLIITVVGLILLLGIFVGLAIFGLAKAMHDSYNNYRDWY